MRAIQTYEELNALPPGSVVYYTVFYDGLNHLLAEKFNDGVWYSGDTVDGFEPVKVCLTCYLIFEVKQREEYR